jgi:sugar/nucleoside kinase (ribokinase family)
VSHLLVIGGASLDILHVGENRVPSAGGAGMYTAMAARRCGVRVSLFAPRPVPMPVELQPVAERLHQWLGPFVGPDELPRFEIAHEGGTTTYLDAFFGAESALSPDSLPADLSDYDIVHVVPLGDVRRQLGFIRTARTRGATLVSAGTYIRGVDSGSTEVRRIVEETDIFFMNRDEAAALFGSLEGARTAAGKLLFITLGSEGARVVQGGCASEVPSAPANEVDPTGAGDTFCGAALAGLIRRQHPVMAARSAAALAASMVEHVGPKALFFEGPLPNSPTGGGVEINGKQAGRIARLVAGLDDVEAFPFIGPGLPTAGHPEAVEFFFAATLQQFGFWHERDGRFDRPMVARIGGTDLKGSAYLFAAFLRRLERDGGFCSPARQADLSREVLLDVFRADDGSDPLPALDLHLAQARQYGRDMLALGLSPQGVLQRAQSSSHPLWTLLDQLDRIGGYKEDPLRKKSSLLALILSQRPERFLPFGSDEQVAPVIDYHLMRSCLRTGLVDVRDGELREALAKRLVVEARQEWAVRHAAYHAIEQVITASGKSSGAVDWFFFNARQRCPEMSRPECARCPLDPVCAHRIELFQPVYRTSWY